MSVAQENYTAWQRAFLAGLNERPEKAGLIDDSSLLWTAAKLPEKSDKARLSLSSELSLNAGSLQQFHFTFAALAVNELRDDEKVEIL